MEIRLLSSVIDIIEEGVYFVDLEGRITFWNRGAERISGYKSSDVLGRRCSDNLLRHVDSTGRSLCLEGCPLQAAMKNGRLRKADVFLHHREGQRVPVAVRTKAVRDNSGKMIGAVEVFSDRSERSSLLGELERLKQVVLTDPLTGIGNRVFLRMCAETRVREFEGDGVPYGLLMIDIDRFKDVNDNHGHAVGDQTLRMVADTVANALRRNDIVARFGGEEFVVLSPNVTVESLAEMAERVRALVEKSWIDMPDLSQLSVTVSVGGALARPGESFEALTQRADQRLYECKKAGRNRVLVGD